MFFYGCFVILTQQILLKLPNITSSISAHNILVFITLKCAETTVYELLKTKKGEIIGYYIGIRK